MLTISRRSVVAGGAATATVVTLAGAAGGREFRAADTQPMDYPTVQALLRMDRFVQARTGGRHSIKVFHSRQLGEEKETIEQTRVGAIDINRSSAAPFASFVPHLGVLALPYLFRSVEHMHKVVDGAIGEEILGGFEAHGFVGLAFYDSGARSIYNAVRPVAGLADLKGLRIRVQQSDVMVAMVKALGAEPVPLPYGQVTTGLSTGLIDGAENNWPSYVSTDHYRHARFHTATDHAIVPEVLAISLKAWASLDAEDRRIFREAAKDSAAFMRDEWADRERRARTTAVGSGVKLVEAIDKKPFIEAMKPVYDEFVVDPAHRSLVERIRQVE